MSDSERKSLLGGGGGQKEGWNYVKGDESASGTESTGGRKFYSSDDSFNVARRSGKHGTVNVDPADVQKREILVDNYYAPAPPPAQAFTKPTDEEKIRGVSYVVRDHVAGGVKQAEPTRIKFPWFDERTYIQESSGFSFFSCCFDQTPQVPLEIPTQEAVIRYISSIVETCGLTGDVAIVSLILLERLLKMSNLPLYPSNWRPIVLISFLLAAKVWGDDEIVFTNADFTGILPVTLRDINIMERQFLALLQFDLQVPQTIYANYYFALRARVQQGTGQPSSSASSANRASGVNGDFRTKFYSRMAVPIAGTARVKDANPNPSNLGTSL